MNRNSRSLPAAPNGRGKCPVCAKRVPLFAGWGGVKLIDGHNLPAPSRAGCSGTGSSPVEGSVK